jgi:hypothetical protein
MLTVPAHNKKGVALLAMLEQAHNRAGAPSVINRTHAHLGAPYWRSFHWVVLSGFGMIAQL